MYYVQLTRSIALVLITMHNTMPTASSSVIIELKLKVNYKRIPISV